MMKHNDGQASSNLVNDNKLAFKRELESVLGQSRKPSTAVVARLSREQKLWSKEQSNNSRNRRLSQPPQIPSFQLPANRRHSQFPPPFQFLNNRRHSQQVTTANINVIQRSLSNDPGHVESTSAAAKRFKQNLIRIMKQFDTKEARRKLILGLLEEELSYEYKLLNDPLSIKDIQRFKKYIETRNYKGCMKIIEREKQSTRREQVLDYRIYGVNLNIDGWSRAIYHCDTWTSRISFIHGDYEKMFFYLQRANKWNGTGNFGTGVDMTIRNNPKSNNLLYFISIVKSENFYELGLHGSSFTTFPNDFSSSFAYLYDSNKVYDSNSLLRKKNSYVASIRQKIDGALKQYEQEYKQAYAKQE